MEQVRIGDTDMTSSRLGLGTGAIGGAMWGGTDDGAAVHTILTALEAGINLIDTAPIFGHGHAEEIVGQALREYGSRYDVLVATKAGVDWSGSTPELDASASAIRRSVEESLRRMRTDHIDLLQLHAPDPQIGIADAAATLAALHQEGKIRAIGVSGHSPEQMIAFRQAAPLHAAQVPFNLFEREMEAEVLPFCAENCITLLACSPLCRGLLAGRTEPDAVFRGDDLRQHDPKFQAPRRAQYLAAVDRLDRFARENFDRRVVHLALRWVLDQPGAGVALWGAREPEQLDPLEEVWGWALDADALRTIDRIVEAKVTDPVGPEFMAFPGDGQGSGAGTLWERA